MKLVLEKIKTWDDLLTNKPSDTTMRFVPQLSEEQVKFWVETENIDYVEIIKLIANGEMSPKALNTEIFENESWDPTEE